MLYAPSHLWSCRFRAIACILTVGSYALFGMAALLLIVPFLLFYPLFSYGAFRDSAVSVLVDKGRLFVRQGLDPEIEYALHDVASFVVIRYRFKTLYQLNILEWFFPNLKKPVRVVMKKADGTQILLFSYQDASPLKRNWSKFAAQLALQTGKTIHLQEEAIS